MLAEIIQKVVRIPKWWSDGLSLFHFRDSSQFSKFQIPNLDSQLTAVRQLVYSHLMDNKYQIPKSKKPETKIELLQHEIEQLVKRRDQTKDLAEKKTLNAEITKLFAQYERLKL
jgi:hypothetical protein